MALARGQQDCNLHGAATSFAPSCSLRARAALHPCSMQRCHRWVRRRWGRRRGSRCYCCCWRCQGSRCCWQRQSLPPCCASSRSGQACAPARCHTPVRKGWRKKATHGRLEADAGVACRRQAAPAAAQHNHAIVQSRRTCFAFFLASTTTTLRRCLPARRPGCSKRECPAWVCGLAASLASCIIVNVLVTTQWWSTARYIGAIGSEQTNQLPGQTQAPDALPNYRRGLAMCAQ